MAIHTSQKKEPAPVVLRCAVPAPLYTALDYLPPKAPADTNNPVIVPGVRVRLPLGRRTLVGVVLSSHQNPSVASNKLRHVDAVLDDEPLIGAKHLALLEWAAGYYLHPIGESCVLGLSPRERRGEPPAATGQPGIALNDRGKGLPQGALSRAKKQAQLLALLQQRPHTITEIERQGISRAVIRALTTKDLITRFELASDRPFVCREPLVANPQQKSAIEGVCSNLGSFACHLLEGVTGSGKTEVYLQCIAATVARGQQVLVILPEIGLTPQMVARFESRFDSDIALLHSGLADGERDRNWSMARSGQAKIILGTRSAVFAPSHALGLIIVDEEHDVSLSQQDGLRYSARDVAVKRGQLFDCPVLLGSATPSLESMSNAVSGRYRYHQLQHRAGGAQAPSKRVLDIRGLDLAGGLSETLRQRVEAVLAKDEQVLLFVNRRGFAPSVLCHDCGWSAECDHCDARLTLHRRPAELRCHHCAQRKHLPRTCPTCHGNRLVSAGVGTEQVEQVLQQYYPATPVYRVDSDTMTGRQSMANLTNTLENTGAGIVLGTQMLSKGHHFPRVTCVGVLDADALLFNPDFRGEERLLQLLTQVGGRAGRAERPGEVVIQTRHPDHPLIQAVLEQSYDQLANTLLKQRQQHHLPPAGAIAVIRCDSRTLDAGMEFLQAVAQPADRNARREIDRYSANLIGPLPSPMARRAGLYRCQLIVHGSERREVLMAARTLQRIAASLKAPTGLRWFIDVDPVEST